MNIIVQLLMFVAWMRIGGEVYEILEAMDRKWSPRPYVESPMMDFLILSLVWPILIPVVIVFAINKGGAFTPLPRNL